MTQTALMLGASGRFGRNAAQQFEIAGWNVRRFDRARDDLSKAAEGADVIVNAWNPPYPDWEKALPAMHARVQAAAKHSGATVIVPGNVYVFGPDTQAPWSETSLHGATNPLGRVRIEMERSYRASGVRTIVLRAGDFIDTEASGNWFDQVMIKSLRKGRFTYPGRPDIPHTWAFLPDLCLAAVKLAERRRDLPDFADIPFPGYTLTGQAIADHLAKPAGQPIQLRQMSWLPLHLARPVWSMARCLLEMRYLWNTPHSLDGSAFHTLLPDYDDTPIEQALQQAVGWKSVQRQINPDQPVAAGG